MQQFPARYELKYRVNTAQAQRLTASLLGIMHFDKHSTTERPRYHVRSLYFDTPTLEAYHGKLAGLRTRAKLRLRTYGEAGGIAYLELKRKEGPFIIKSRVQLPPESPWRGDGRTLLAWLRSEIGRNTPPAWLKRPLDPMLERFILWPGVSPIVVVAYDRLAFAGDGPANPRITFDYNVRGTASDKLVPATHLRPALNGAVVLELKFTRRMPALMGALIQGHGLMAEAVSKYCAVAEASAPLYSSGTARFSDEGLAWPDTAMLYHAPHRPLRYPALGSAERPPVVGPALSPG